MSLTLRRIVWSDGTSRPDDFNVIHDGRIVGRMYRMNSTGRELWRWTQSGIFQPTHGENGGVADLRCQGGIPGRMGSAVWLIGPGHDRSDPLPQLRSSRVAVAGAAFIESCLPPCPRTAERIRRLRCEGAAVSGKRRARPGTKYSGAGSGSGAPGGIRGGTDLKAHHTAH